MNGWNLEPENLVEEAADAAFEAIHAALEAQGARLERALVLVEAADVPTGELESVSAGTGVEGPADVVAMLVAHAVEAGKAIGLSVIVAPVHRG